jgi:hypothetical protein
MSDIDMQMSLIAEEGIEEAAVVLEKTAEKAISDPSYDQIAINMIAAARYIGENSTEDLNGKIAALYNTAQWLYENMESIPSSARSNVNNVIEKRDEIDIILYPEKQTLSESVLLSKKRLLTLSGIDNIH